MDTTDKQKLRLRATLEEDFPSIIAIEKEAYPNPWPDEAFTDFLLSYAWSLLFEDEIVGYVFYHGVGDEMVIINIAVKPGYHGLGWGDFLLSESMDLLIAKGVTKFYLDVRISNLPARSLYDKHGFKPLGIRKGYYSHPDEDALVMGKMIK
jgi:ribosomal-protein-alanine N-acetyltransferase